MITDKRKEQIFQFAKLCIVEDKSTSDGFELKRPSICNDEEWDWLYNGYTKAKEACQLMPKKK